MAPETEKIVQKVREIAVLPQVASQVMDLTMNPNATARDLERVISVDPGMSSRILNTVNSAYYALPRKIASIKEAVVFLGFKTIRHVAMTAGAFEMFVGKTDRQNIRRRTWWRHAIDTALCARLIASQVPQGLTEEAYTAGLLHDIGKPLLDRYGGVGYDQVETLLQKGVPLLEAEGQVYGCDHALLGREISLHWRFPQNLADAIGGHHAIEAKGLSEPWLAAVTALANYLAHHVREQGEPSEVSPAFELPEWTLEVLNLTSNAIQTLTLACEAELSESPLQALAA